MEGAWLYRGRLLFQPIIFFPSFQPDIHTDRQTDGQTDGQTYRETDR